MKPTGACKNQVRAAACWREKNRLKSAYLSIRYLFISRSLTPRPCRAGTHVPKSHLVSEFDRFIYLFIWRQPAPGGTAARSPTPPALRFPSGSPTLSYCLARAPQGGPRSTRAQGDPPYCSSASPRFAGRGLALTQLMSHLWGVGGRSEGGAGHDDGY